MKLIGIITTVLFTLIVTPIWRGYVLSKLWLWFIVSTFAVNPLGVAQSIGIALTAAFLTHQHDSDKAKDETKTSGQKLVNSIALAFLSPAVSLFVGWIVKQWL